MTHARVKPNGRSATWIKTKQSRIKPKCEPKRKTERPFGYVNKNVKPNGRSATWTKTKKLRIKPKCEPKRKTERPFGYVNKNKKITHQTQMRTKK